jgi:NADPH:quinone reductase-like Zn-dependent oxidoreductase
MSRYCDDRQELVIVLELTKSYLGAWSEYAKCPEEYIALKPQSFSFESAASIPLAGLTALQALRKYDGDLSGKTVFVPAGCMIYPSSYLRCLLTEWQ